jgi:hypothetical protein
VHQSLLTMSMEVQPRNVDALRRCIQDLKDAIENRGGLAAGADPYDGIGMAVPALHFISIMVFEDDWYDPLLTVEANFDGDPTTFLPQLEVPALEPFLREMIRCCKRPSDGAGDMYDAIIKAGSKTPLTPFLETRIHRPATYHQGNRGLDRKRILAEQNLFVQAQTELESPGFDRAGDAKGIHQRLRANLIGPFPWLAEPEPERWTLAERVGDYARLVGFVAVTFICLSAPGMILALLMPPIPVFLICAGVAVVLLSSIKGFWAALRPDSARVQPIPGLPAVPPPTNLDRARPIVAVAAFLVGYLVVVALVPSLALAPLNHRALGDVFQASLLVVATGLTTVAMPAAAILFWLRWLERRDSSQDDPHNDPETLTRMMALEDQIAQNHMGSLVIVKPGVLRGLALRAGLMGLGFYLRATQTEGYLASMRTIHFAHWAILSNGGRLVFFSNFDGSWESYLDDFIEKAHPGLTLAWTNGVGFPPTSYLVLKGATNGRQFKAWARQSMAVTLFWFSAYKDLSVNQIERQYRIASGLRKPALSDGEARKWAYDL